VTVNNLRGIHINSKITASRLTTIHFLDSIILKQFKLFQCYIPVEQPRETKKVLPKSTEEGT